MVQRVGVGNVLRMLSERPANHVTTAIDDMIIWRCHIAILKRSIFSVPNRRTELERDLHPEYDDQRGESPTDIR